MSLLSQTILIIDFDGDDRSGGHIEQMMWWGVRNSRYDVLVTQDACPPLN